MQRIVRVVIGVAVALVALYFVGGGIITTLLLRELLTPGAIDWSRSNNPDPPKDPLELNYRGDPKAAFGYDFQTITYTTALGGAEAWLVPASSPSPVWAIYVHGIGGLRENGYKQLSVLHEAGIPTLLITYRNDKGAPSSPNHLYSFGLTEWQDVDDAVAWMLSNGAQRVVLVAESMGGAIAGEFLINSKRADKVVGLALDAPALDFNAIVLDKLEKRHLPFAQALASLGILGIELLNGTDLGKADTRAAVETYPGPLFLAQGTTDELVPASIAEGVVAKRSAPTIYLETGANHLLSFKENPAKYREDFLAMLKLIAP